MPIEIKYTSKPGEYRFTRSERLKMKELLGDYHSFTCLGVLNRKNSIEKLLRMTASHSFSGGSRIGA